MLNEPRGTALKVGPHAMRIVEPRQARKGATVRRPFRVPWEYLTGAGSAGRSQCGSIDGGCTVTIYEYEREVGLKRGWPEIEGRGADFVGSIPAQRRARSSTSSARHT